MRPTQDQQAQRRAYAAAVLNVLTPEFPGLTDPLTAEIVTTAVIHACVTPESRTFECIVDAPDRANWRLKNDPDRPGRVVLACYRHPASDADNDREQRINSDLAALT